MSIHSQWLFVKKEYGKHHCAFGMQWVCVKSLQSCPTLCEPMDCSPPGSSVHGILQTRILERVAMSSSRGSFDPWIEPMSLTSPELVDVFFLLPAPPGKPWSAIIFCKFRLLNKNYFYTWKIEKSSRFIQRAVVKVTDITKKELSHPSER